MDEPIRLTLSVESLERGWITPLREAAAEYLKLASDAWSLQQAASHAAKAAEIFAKAAAMEQIKNEMERLDEASAELNKERETP